MGDLLVYAIMQDLVDQTAAVRELLCNNQKQLRFLHQDDLSGIVDYRKLSSVF